MLGLTDRNIEVITEVLRLTNSDLDESLVSKLVATLKRYDHGVLKDRQLEFLLEILSLSPQRLDINYIAKNCENDSP
jgi:hypothetical protein